MSLCSHLFELSDLLLCLYMHTLTFSSSLRYASMFLASSVLQLLHNMLLHACITHNRKHPSPLCSAFLYSLCTFCIPHVQCLCMLFTVTIFPQQVVHCSSTSHLHSSTAEYHSFTVLRAFLTSSHLMIIITTLHLLWQFCCL
jgi:hypothetical protein